MKKVLFKIHFSCFVIVILNTIFKHSIGISLLSQIEWGLKLIIAVTGLFLFFQYFKTNKKIKFYFLAYVISTFLLILSIVFRGILAGIIVSLILYPIQPDDVAYQKDDIIIYNHYQGFMGMCCPYKVTQTKGFIFEKSYGILKNEGKIDFLKSQFLIVNNTIELTFEDDFFDNEKQNYIKKDTTIILKGK